MSSKLINTFVKFYMYIIDVLNLLKKCIKYFKTKNNSIITVSMCVCEYVRVY